MIKTTRLIVRMMHSKRDTYRLLDHEGNELTRGTFDAIVASLETRYEVTLTVEPSGNCTVDGMLVCRIEQVED